MKENFDVVPFIVGPTCNLCRVICFWFCKCTRAKGSSALLWSMRRPSVRPSVRRRLLFTFSTSETAEWNSTKIDSKQDPLPSLCFTGRSEIQDGRPGLWLAEALSTSLKPLKGIHRKLTGSKISTSSTKFVFSGRSEIQSGCPGLWLAETFLTSSLKPLKGIQRNFFFCRKQDLNGLYQVRGFHADRKTKMAALASNWLRHFSTSSLKPLNRI